MRESGKKSFGVDIDPSLEKIFTKQYMERGFYKYRSLEGAIRLWINLPTELQSRIIESSDSDIADIYNDLGNRLRTALRSALALEKPKKKN